VVGRIRLPLTLTHRPWATMYRSPDGATFWVVRLWIVDRPVGTRFATSTLHEYAVRNQLPAVAKAIEEVVEQAYGVDAGC
jgi:hypothetical protein